MMYNGRVNKPKNMDRYIARCGITRRMTHYAIKTADILAANEVTQFESI